VALSSGYPTKTAIREDSLFVNKAKILLSSRPKLVSDVIRDLIDRQPDMEVVGEVIDPIELLRVAGETAVDVVIVTPIGTDAEPRICHHLLVGFPDLKVVALSERGDAAFLYQTEKPRLRIDDPTTESILGAIRGALQ
jgi:DNA-binding NarL/FixJ family response regulator